MRSRVRTRSAAEKAAAEEFHATGRRLNGGKCVRCGGRAGRFSHHVPEKSWLRRHGWGHRMWDADIACPVCDDCHAQHTSGAFPITRSHLIRSGVWARVWAWAEARDVEPPSGRVIRRPVTSRLDREYPPLKALPHGRIMVPS